MWATHALSVGAMHVLGRQELHALLTCTCKLSKRSDVVTARCSCKALIAGCILGLPALHSAPQDLGFQRSCIRCRTCPGSYSAAGRRGRWPSPRSAKRSCASWTPSWPACTAAPRRPPRCAQDLFACAVCSWRKFQHLPPPMALSTHFAGEVFAQDVLEARDGSPLHCTTATCRPSWELRVTDMMYLSIWNSESLACKINQCPYS